MFEVISDGTAVTISSYTVDGAAKAVILTLARAIQPGETLYVSYTDPTASNDTTAIQDTAGNDAQTFYRKLVTNFSVDTTQPKLVANSAINNIINLKFDLTLTANVPATSRFSATVNGVACTPIQVNTDGSDRLVYLTLPVTTVYGDVITVTYNAADGAGTKILGANGNAAVAFTGVSVVNQNAYTVPYEPNNGGGGGQ